MPVCDAMRKQPTATGRNTTTTNPNKETPPTMTTTPPRRDHRMPTGGSDDIARDYAYMCGDNTADDELRDAAATAVERWRSAIGLAADERADHIATAGELRRIERAADDELWQTFAAGKRPPIDATVTRLAKTTTESQRARDRYQYAERIEQRAASEMARVIHERRRAVIAWVASHRASTDDAAAQCGDVLALPVLRMWWRLGILLDQPTPHGLDLAPWETNGRLHRLPVEWPLTLDAKYRAGLAWWWRRIHDGAYIITDRGRLVVTAAPYGALPQVPPSPPTTQTPRRR